MADTEKILQFCETVGADPALAQKYLAVSDNHLENAIALYLDTGGVDLPDVAIAQPAPPRFNPAPPAAPPAPRTYKPSGRDTVDWSAIPSDDEDVRPSAARPAPAAAARSNAFSFDDDDEDMEVDMDFEYDSNNDDDEDIVEVSRAQPASSATTTTVTLDSDGEEKEDSSAARRRRRRQPSPPRLPAASFSSSSSGRAAAGGARARSPPMFGQGFAAASGLEIRGSRPPAATTANPFAQSSGRSDASRISTAATDRSSRLADMFRAPTELMFRGTFENAKEHGRVAKKWLLVDLHDASIFACQCLNRDLWKHRDVVAVLRDHFLFLQFPTDGPDGRQFRTFYPVTAFPHVCVIDPRTGERVKVLTTAHLQSPAAFAEALFEFLDLYSLDPGANTPVPMPSSNSGSKADLAKSRSVQDMSEDEQLQAALLASMETGDSTSASASAAPVVISDSDSDSDADLPATTTIAAVAPSSATVDPEPPAGAPNTTRIQFRFPDGSRHVRRFRLGDRVLDLYRAVKAVVPDANDHAFELVFVRQNLAEWIDRDVGECGLQNAAVTMTYVE
ncbi:UBX domain protein Ubx2 [Blastocladiella emersonii ATCC 22665]|nr:UBX domain protein Ubx2 [Blastocladiella emersonii ATCC 22665]